MRPRTDTVFLLRSAPGKQPLFQRLQILLLMPSRQQNLPEERGYYWSRAPRSRHVRGERRGRWPSGTSDRTSVSGPGSVKKSSAYQVAIFANTTAAGSELNWRHAPELTCKAMFLWAKRRGITLHFIRPGKPMQNAFVECFNGKFRDTCLNQHWLIDLNDARTGIDDWREHYHQARPRSSPDIFAAGRVRENGSLIC